VIPVRWNLRKETLMLFMRPKKKKNKKKDTACRAGKVKPGIELRGEGGEEKKKEKKAKNWMRMIS